MASTEDWKNWVFNFYYGEELRSLYMNGMLLAGFRPGIYNANIFSFIDNSGSNPVFNLLIKRGTTFIFSNNYKNVDDSVERDFFNLGKETFASDDQYAYLIKCVANKDILISSDVFGDFGRQGIFGPDVVNKYKQDIHIFASIQYKAKSNNSATSNSFPVVNFEPYYTVQSSGARRFQKLNNANVDLNTIPPDGMKYSDFEYACTRGSHLLEYSFLDVGIIRRINPNGKLLPDNYVFTGHGLPEYRQSMTANASISTPDFYISHDLKTLYLDIPGISCDNTFYSYTDLNINKCISEEDKKGIIQNEEENTLLKASISEISEESINENNLFLDGDLKYKYFVDFFYLHTNKKYFNLKNLDLDGVLKDVSSSGLEFESIGLELEGPNNYCASKAAERSYSYLEIDSMDPGLDAENFKVIRNKAVVDVNKKDSFQHNLYDIDSAYHNLYIDTQGVLYAAITPLDISIANQQRMINLIKNKPLISRIIDYVRQTKDNAEEYSTIIPVALAFRKYVKPENSQSGESSYWVGTFNDSKDKIDPANILSLFDLQFKESKFHAVTAKDSNVYNTLAVIE